MTIKLTKKQQTIIQISTLVVVVVVTVVFMLRPGKTKDLLDNDYSIADIRDKRNEIEQLNDELDHSIREVDSLKDQKMTAKTEARKKELELEAIKAGIEDVDFELHIPSILVFLDQEASARDLDLRIDYQDIQEHSNTPEEMTDEEYPEEEMNEDMMEEDMTEEEMNEEESVEEGMGGEEYDDITEPEELEEDDTDTPDNSEENIGEDGEDVEQPDTNNTQTLDYTTPSIPGVNITTVPIQLKGNFSDVRSFIRELDDIDFIENNSIRLSSNGQEVTATIILNVYHIEGGA